MKKPRKTARRTKDGLKILDWITGNDPELREDIAEANVNFRVAQLIHDARAAAKLTQQQLAHLVGKKQSVIARLEDADYGARDHILSGSDRLVKTRTDSPRGCVTSLTRSTVAPTVSHVCWISANE